MVTLTHFLEGNPLPPHRLLFSMSSKGSIDRTVHTTAFDKPVVDHWLERKIARVVKAMLGSYLATGSNAEPIELFLIPASAPQLV